jgi:hypothetical protein
VAGSARGFGRRALTAGVVTLLVSACDAPEPVSLLPDSGPPPSMRLAVSGAATLGLGSTAVVTVTVVREGDFTGIVTLSADGLPAGVTGTFAPPTAPNAASAMSTLTLQAALTATPGSFIATARARAAVVHDATADLLITVNP